MRINGRNLFEPKIRCHSICGYCCLIVVKSRSEAPRYLILFQKSYERTCRISPKWHRAQEVVLAWNEISCNRNKVRILFWDQVCYHLNCLGISFRIFTKVQISKLNNFKLSVHVQLQIYLVTGWYKVNSLLTPTLASLNVRIRTAWFCSPRCYLICLLNFLLIRKGH